MNESNLKLGGNIKQYWNNFPVRGRIYTNYEDELRHAIKLDPFYKRLIDSISLKNKVVLDLGCGQGVWSYYMSKKAKRVVGLDISSESINLAKKKYNNLRLKSPITFNVYDGLKIPYENNSFDVVASLGVIHHAVNDLKLVEEAYRVLERGLFVGAVYRKNSPGFFVRNFVSRQKYLEKLLKPGTKNTFLAEIMLCPLARHYSVSEWKMNLESAGFRHNNIWGDFCGLERYLPHCGLYLDRLTLGKLGYYVIWKSFKS